MPELPEAERARQVLEKHAVGRTIASVDDGDAYVCRPHGRGEIDAVLRGATVTAAHRRGKHLWLETDAGVDLSLHLGYVRVGSISVLAAIAKDPSLSPSERRALSTLYRSFSSETVS